MEQKKEYLLEWICNYVSTTDGEEHHDEFKKHFKTLWEARSYAYDFDEHCSDIRIYKLEEEIISEEENEN